MTQLTIKRLDPAVLQALASRAADAGHSLEAEALRLLELAVLPSREGVAARLREAMAERRPAKGGVFSDTATLLRRLRDGGRQAG